MTPRLAIKKAKVVRPASSSNVGRELVAVRSV